MLLLLGASGYVGRAFARELLLRKHAFVPVSRQVIDYTNFNLLFDYIRKMRPEFLINAAGFTGNPDESACDLAREETLAANTLLPQTIARACLMTNVPWGHVSSGAIFEGAKIVENGRMRVERNLSQPETKRLLAEQPGKIFGFNEWDEPNCSFHNVPSNFYSGTKALAEEAIREIGPNYIWRPGLPFNERDEPRNFLRRFQKFPVICEGVNSLSHVDDFARACLNLWERRAPYGIYNVANVGAISTEQIVRMVARILKPERRFEFWKADDEARNEARALRTSCVLDVTKLLNAGVQMRTVEAALEDALRRWQSSGTPLEAGREAPAAHVLRKEPDL